jgi:hypothetical protein
VRLNIQRASNYVLTVVLYAVVLLFAGTSTRIRKRQLRLILASTDGLVLLGARTWISTFPISLEL